MLSTLSGRIHRQELLLGLQHAGCRAIMRFQPCPASLTSRRVRAAPPALGVGDAACPNNEEGSRAHPYLSKPSLSTRNSPDNYDLHALREPAAVRRRFRQPALRLQDFLPPLAHTDKHTARCDCYTLHAMGDLGGLRT